MKNLPIRRQVIEQVITNWHEESPHPKTNDRSSRSPKSGDPSLRSGHVAGLLIFPNINRHEESPNPETNDPPTVILNAGG